MLSELGKQAFNALQHNRRRSLLTMLDMAWGIATVVLLLAYGTGFQNGLMIAFRTFGGNLIGIFPGRTSVQAGGTKAGAQVRLTRDDLDYLRAEVPTLTRISPEVDKQSLVSFGTRSSTYGVHGIYSAYEKIRALDVGEGT
jgi:putative ABC transport system permease protein